MFDHEKLDVYNLELKFIGWVTPLLEEISKTAAGTLHEESCACQSDALRIEGKVDYRSKVSRTRTN